MTQKFSGILIAALGAAITACSLGGDLDSIHQKLLESKTFTITFNLNGGEGTAPSAQTVKGGTSVTLPDDSGFSLAEYTFIGWNTKSNGTGTSYSAGNKRTLTSNVTLYAQWDINQYIISFDMNGGEGITPSMRTVNSGESVTLPNGSGFSRSGYTFAGWKTNYDGPGTNYNAGDSYTLTGSSVTLFARWQYTVMFDINHGDGTPPELQTVESYESVPLPAQGEGSFSRSGYTFAGWNTASDGTGTNYLPGLWKLAGNVTLYAKWLLPIESPNLGTLMPIPTGTFMMGSPGTEPNRNSDETQHSVTLSVFYMGKYEITQEQYEAVMGNNPSNFKSGAAAGENQGKRPVEQVSWYDAIVFCNKLSMMEGLTPAYSIGGNTNPSVWGAAPTSSNSTWDAVVCNWNANGYRLPTEAEWEYACRAGTTTAYNTGDMMSDDTGWYYDNSNNITHEVGKKPANAYGLYDMHGNVWEWCWDWYGSYGSAAQTDPVGASSGSYRMLRGGGWNSSAQHMRSAYRNFYNPSDRFNSLGFRLVRPQF